MLFITSDLAQRNLPEVMGQEMFYSAQSAGFGKEIPELCSWICDCNSSKTSSRTLKHLCGSHYPYIKQNNTEHSAERMVSSLSVRWLQKPWVPGNAKLLIIFLLVASICGLTSMLCSGGACDSMFIWLMATNMNEGIHAPGRKCSKIRWKKAWATLPFSKYTVMEILEASHVDKL